MNILQRLPGPVTCDVTRNRSEAIDPDLVLRRFVCDHPMFDAAHFDVAGDHEGAVA